MEEINLRKSAINKNESKNEKVEEEKPPILAPPAAINHRKNFTPASGSIGSNKVLLYSENEHFSSKSDEYYQRYSSVERHNEDLAIRFLFGNGQSLGRIDDPNFRKFLSNLNSSRAPPENDNIANKSTMEVRPSLDYNRINGPLSITIEAIRKNDEVFLSISVHYYNEDGERQNTVHFEKVILADYEGKVVADRLRRVVDPKKTMSIPIFNIVSPNIRMVQLLSETTKFKNKALKYGYLEYVPVLSDYSMLSVFRFICFFSYLSNIARETIQITEIFESLKVLRDYVEAVRKHPEVYAKFRKEFDIDLQQEKNISAQETTSLKRAKADMVQSTINNLVELPVIDGSEWLSTLQFISACSSLNPTFQEIHESWCMPDYLTLPQENVLACLIDFLTVLCKIATKVCSGNSCVSQVLYSMSLISHAIEECGILNVRRKMRSVFEKYFTSISTGKIGDFYAISGLLDPRYGYSTTIFSLVDWQNVEKKLLKESISNLDTKNQWENELIQELFRFRQILLHRRPDPDIETSHWWRNMSGQMPLLFKKWIEYSGPPAVSIDGKRLFAKGGKLAHMYATLDETFHYKGMLLAQSSQNFVGRGSCSRMVIEVIKNEITSFRRTKKELDEGDHNKKEIDMILFHKDQEIKIENHGDYESPSNSSRSARESETTSKLKIIASVIEDEGPQGEVQLDVEEEEEEENITKEYKSLTRLRQKRGQGGNALQRKTSTYQSDDPIESRNNNRSKYVSGGSMGNQGKNQQKTGKEGTTKRKGVSSTNY